MFTHLLTFHSHVAGGEGQQEERRDKGDDLPRAQSIGWRGVGVEVSFHGVVILDSSCIAAHVGRVVIDSFSENASGQESAAVASRMR